MCFSQVWERERALARCGAIDFIMWKWTKWHFHHLPFIDWAHMIYCILQHFNNNYVRKTEIENIEKEKRQCVKIHLMTCWNKQKPYAKYSCVLLIKTYNMHALKINSLSDSGEKWGQRRRMNGTIKYNKNIIMSFQIKSRCQKVLNELRTYWIYLTVLIVPNAH